MSARLGILVASAVLALEGCGGLAGDARGSGPDAAFVPATVEQALAELRHTQARDGDWRGWGPYSSVTLRRHGRTEAGDYDEEALQAVTDVDASGTVLEVVGVPGTRQRAELDVPELAAAEARAAGSETIVVAGRPLETRIYEFVQRAGSRAGVLTTAHRFWLAAGIPTGVARHDSFQTESDDATERASANGSTRLTDIGLPIRVGGRTLSCYCYQSEVRLRGGEVQRSRFCKSPAVPGGTVKYEVVRSDGTRETARAATEVTDFETHPLARAR